MRSLQVEICNFNAGPFKDDYSTADANNFFLALTMQKKSQYNV